MNKEIYSFVRKKIKSGNRKGQLVIVGAVLATGYNRVGWSRCHFSVLNKDGTRSKGDTFDKVEALRIARERANTGANDCCTRVPKDIDVARANMRLRSQRYFKQERKTAMDLNAAELARRVD